jgi:hypothetical protein
LPPDVLPARSSIESGGLKNAKLENRAIEKEKNSRPEDAASSPRENIKIGGEMRKLDICTDRSLLF